LAKTTLPDLKPSSIAAESYLWNGLKLS
jgi:hypothetical protein